MREADSCVFLPQVLPLLPPWPGLALLLAGALAWQSRSRRKSVALTALYFCLFSVVLSVARPTAFNRLFLVAALISHLFGLLARDPALRRKYFAFAAFCYGAYVYLAGLGGLPRKLLLFVLWVLNALSDEFWYTSLPHLRATPQAMRIA